MRRGINMLRWIGYPRISWARPAPAALALVAASALWNGQGGAEAPAWLLKLATVAPEGSTWMKVLRDIDTEVRKETGNAVGFKIYAGGVQGDEQVVLRKVRSGQLHGGAFTGAGLGVI